MKAYLSFLKLRINMGLQYRTAAIAGLLTQFFWGFMQIMIYKAFYETGIKTDMPFEQLVSYVWLQQSFFALVRLLIIDQDICESIITGNIAYELVRPIDIYWFWYSKMIASRVSSVLMRFWPILIVAFILPTGYALTFPVSISAFILFIITLALGIFITTSLMILSYIIMFYTTTSKGLIKIYGIIGEFFSGTMIPIPLMPAVIQGIAYILPFRFICDLPFRLYVGNISITEALPLIGIEFIWIVSLIFIGKTLIKNSINKVVVQGG